MSARSALLGLACAAAAMACNPVAGEAAGAAAAQSTPGAQKARAAEGASKPAKLLEITKPPPLETTCDWPKLDDKRPTVYACDCGPGADAKCAPGNDANQGTSPGAPIRSYEAARQRFNRLSPGHAIALCRGGVFSTQPGRRFRQWENPKCRADQPCVVRDYVPPWGSANTALPVILSGPDTAFHLDDDGGANHEEGYVFANLDLRGQQAAGEGFKISNDMDDVLLCGLRIDGFEFGVQVSGSQDPEPGSDGKNERIVLRRSKITNNSGQGWLGACDGCAIEHCYFDNNGYGRKVRNHSIYLGGSGTGERIVGNQIYRSTVIDGKCVGVPIVVHGRHSKLEVSGNFVWEEPGQASNKCWGISVDGGYGDEPEEFSDVRIADNTIVNVGRVAVGLSSCVRCAVSGNKIVLENAGPAVGISSPVRELGPGDSRQSHITITDNLMQFGAAVTQATGVQLGDEGDGHRVENNRVRLAGAGPGTCFELGERLQAYASMDRNRCDLAKRGERAWAHGLDLAAWRKKSGFDKASAAD